MDPQVTVLQCVAIRLERWDHPNLSAPYWRLYWNDRAGAEVRTDGRATPLAPDRLVLIPPDTPYASALARPVGHLYLHVVLDLPCAPVPPAVHVVPAGEDTRSIAAELYGDVVSHGPAGGGFRREFLVRALIHRGLAGLPGGTFRPVRLDPRVEAAVRAMERAIDRPPGNRDLAAAARMHETAFIRLFRSETGRSPQAYGQILRVSKACVMLNDTTAGIKEIAAATGFYDRHHFTRVFRARRGVSPAAFRERMRIQAGEA